MSLWQSTGTTTSKKNSSIEQYRYHSISIPTPFGSITEVKKNDSMFCRWKKILRTVATVLSLLERHRSKIGSFKPSVIPFNRSPSGVKIATFEELILQTGDLGRIDISFQIHGEYMFGFYIYESMLKFSGGSTCQNSRDIILWEEGLQLNIPST